MKHRLYVHPHEPVVSFSTSGGEIGLEQDASKEDGASSGKPLARSWKAARSANEASPAFFVLKKCILQNAHGSAAVVHG